MSLTNLLNKGKESPKDIPNNNKVTALKNYFNPKLLSILFAAFATWCAGNGWPKNNTPFIDSLSVPPQIQKWNENKSLFPEGLEQSLTDSGINSNNTSFNVVENKGTLSISWVNQGLKVSVEESNRIWTIVWVEYAVVWDEVWTLITVRTGSGYKSWLITWVYKWVDFSSKITAWRLEEDIKWVTIWQNFIWAEIEKLFEQWKIGAYASATDTDTKTLSVSEITWTDVPGWREWSQTTTRWIWAKTYAAWWKWTYFNPTTKIDWNLGYRETRFWGETERWVDYGLQVSKLLVDSGWELKWWLEWFNAWDYKSNTYYAWLNYNFDWWVTAWIRVKKIDDTSYDDEIIMFGISIPLWWPKNSDTPKRTYTQSRGGLNVNDIDHVTWGRHATSQLYGYEKEETNTWFEAAPDVEAPVLNSTNQTFTTTVWTPLTLVNVEATDNVDWSVTVVQGWDTVDFNTAWTYNVTYTATDSAGNSSITITHIYQVNALPLPTITFGADTTVNDTEAVFNWADTSIDITYTNIQAWATFRIVSVTGWISVNAGDFSIDWNWDISYTWDAWSNQTVNLTIWVTNPGQAEITWSSSITVIDDV